MEIDKLCELCIEYDTKQAKAMLLRSVIESYKNNPNLTWMVERDHKRLFDVLSRLKEIQSLITNSGDIIFHHI